MLSSEGDDILCRPLRVLVEDCRVMIDVEARNAIIAMVMHLLSAFKMPARPRTPQACRLTSLTLHTFRNTCTYTFAYHVLWCSLQVQLAGF